MAIKIKSKVLTDFLNKAKMSGTQEIAETLLQFTSDGLRMNANTPSNHARVMALLKPTAFIQYEDIGSVGVNDLNTIVLVLGRFEGDIILTKEGNLLSVKGEAGKSVEIELVDEHFITVNNAEPKLEFGSSFKLPISTIKGIFKDVTINKDCKMIIETENGKVIFKNTGKYKFRTEVLAPTVTGTAHVNFGNPFFEVVQNLDTDLEVSVKSDYPCKLIETTQHSEITMIIAPIIENE